MVESHGWAKPVGRVPDRFDGPSLSIAAPLLGVQRKGRNPARHPDRGDVHVQGVHARPLHCARSFAYGLPEIGWYSNRWLGGSDETRRQNSGSAFVAHKRRGLVDDLHRRLFPSGYANVDLLTQLPLRYQRFGDREIEQPLGTRKVRYFKASAEVNDSTGKYRPVHPKAR